MTDGPADTPMHFRARHRLAHARDFQAVFGAKVRKSRGPITVFALPNHLPRARLGLSIGARCGGAVVRNAVKRRVREAFRLSQHLLPPGFDYVVAARAHAVRKTQWYAELLQWCALAAAREWEKRDGVARGDTP